MRSCDMQQQATRTSPIAMDAIIVITNCNGCNQCLHHEVPKRSQNKPLKCNEEGRGNQPQSHKAVLPMKTTRASWERHEYHNDTHTTTMIIAARASIVAKPAQRMQTATFHQSAQESRVVCSMWQWQLLSLSAWLTRAAQAPRWRRSRQWHAQQQEESLRPRASSPDAYTVSTPITCTTSAMLICATKHTNNNNNLQTATKQTKTQPPWHVHYVSRTRQPLDKQWIKLPGRASDTIFSAKRTSASNNNKKYFVSTPKIKRMLVVWCSGPATSTSSWVQSAKIFLNGFSWRGCLDS